MQNEIANVCNTSSGWVQMTQKKLEKATGAIRLGKQNVEEVHEMDEQVSWICSCNLMCERHLIEINSKIILPLNRTKPKKFANWNWNWHS